MPILNFERTEQFVCIKLKNLFLTLTMKYGDIYFKAVFKYLSYCNNKRFSPHSEKLVRNRISFYMK